MSIEILTDDERMILERHKYVPDRYIYHLANENHLKGILNDNALYPHKLTGLYSLTANPHMRTVIPYNGPRKYRIVLDFKKVKVDFDIFPVYYYTKYEEEFEEPPSWVVYYYMDKTGLDYDDLDDWNLVPGIYLPKEPPWWRESEWKGIYPIKPIKPYIINIIMLR